MVTVLILFVLGIIGVVLIGSILGITSSGEIKKLQKQNRNLNARVALLEAGQSKDQPAISKPLAQAVSAPTPVPLPASNSIPEPIIVAPLKPAPVPIKPAAQPDAVKAARPIEKTIQTALPEKPTRNLEELIGGQWSVWVGGLALLVGAVLLIRFSIEAGFFGPAARIGMALVLGVVLLLAGEWLKRSDDEILKGRLGEAAKVLQGNASVPGLLSAVGVFTLLGASYAAHALYGLIPAFLAFMALGIISLGAMALSLRQGQLLAGIGLLASLATPLLIQTNTPSLLMLVIYLTLVGGAALVLSRRTGWGWVATGTVFGWLGWSMMSIEAATNGQLILWSAFLALGFGVTVWLAEQDETTNYDGLAILNLQPIIAIVWSVLAAMLVATLGAISLVSGPTVPVYIVGLVGIGALIGTSVFSQKQSGHLVVGGILAVAFLMMIQNFWQPVVVILLILMIVLLSFRNAERSAGVYAVDVKHAWSIFAVAIGLVSVVILDTARPTGSNEIHAALALAFAAMFAAISGWFRQRGGNWKTLAIPVIGAGLGWTLAATLVFEDLHFSLFMSLGAALTAVVVWCVRMHGARLVLLGLTGLVFAHALFVQFPDTDAISTFPVFNALWVYLALPTTILGTAAYMLHYREEKDDLGNILNGIIEAAALAGLALFAVFQIRHLSNSGAVYAGNLGHAELGLQTSVGLCFTLAGLSKRFAGNAVLSKIAEVISYVTLAGFALGSLVVFSPFFSRGELITGNVVFNSLTTGLLVPTVLLGLCAAMARGLRSETYVNILGGLALAGAVSWVTAMIRFICNGENIHVFRTSFSDLELWTIGAVWLLFGITLLVLGVWRRERGLRIASGIVIILTVLKAFLIDMSGLEGVLRAMSFVALGLILIVIGRAYQRFWLTDSTRNQPPEVDEIGEEE